jgi:Skp family chaperone for outer membrane proteins
VSEGFNILVNTLKKQQKWLDTLEEKYNKQKDEFRKLQAEQESMEAKWQKIEVVMEENNKTLHSQHFLFLNSLSYFPFLLM